MKRIILLVEDEADVKAITDVLEEAEQECILDFPFGTTVEDVPALMPNGQPMPPDVAAWPSEPVFESEAQRLAYLKQRDAAPDLLAALRSCHYELLTLSPRLTAQFRKSVDKTIALARLAIEKAGARP